MASIVQHGRRRGSNKTVSPAEDVSMMIQPPDLRQVTVLTKGEWLRIQDEVNQFSEDEERRTHAAKEREALHLQSKEVVKLWSNTIADQRRKKLEAKKIREETEEEKRKLADKEEAKYQEQQRKEAIEKAHTQLFYQTDHVKGFHRALLLSEVLKEREAQIELKQRIKSASKDVDKAYLDLVKTREDKASTEEQEKALQKKIERQAVAEDLKKQMKEKELLREQQRIEDKKDGEEIQRLKELHLWEQRMEEERQAKMKRNLMHAHLEHVTNRDHVRVNNAQKEKAEEEQRKLFLSAKQKMMKLRKDKETELFREAQMCREQIMDKLSITLQDQSDSEQQRITKAVAEQDAKQAEEQREQEERKAAMLQSIITHRETVRKEREQMVKTEEENARDTLQARKEADRIFSEKQQLKTQRMKEDVRKLQDFNATQMAEKKARHQQLMREEQNFKVKTEALAAEEEHRFQQYSQQVIQAAAEAQRNVFPLCKAAREGIGGGLGPASGNKPYYLVQDCTGVPMPKYVSSATQNIKMLNEAVNIQEGKTRLGFTWL